MMVPEALPPLSHGHRQVPSFAGVIVSPMRRSVYASMLSQVSSLHSHMDPHHEDSGQVQVDRTLIFKLLFMYLLAL